ncbi:Arylsulfatase [Pseudozyma hubeiensis]|nr:Arylsulfatase [Pseudozyma hubeiensis]
MLAINVVSTLLFVVSLLASPAWTASRDPKKPNFVYIIADDQDYATANPHIMPHLSKWLSQHGTNYTHFYTPMSVCCPSRVGFLRSQHGHSHNVTNVVLPFGGWTRFVAQGYRKDWLPTWLQSAGYSTYYTGKLMNGNTVTNWKTSPVLGFNRSALLSDPQTYVYKNASYAIDGTKLVSYPGNYSTDTVRDFGLEYLDEAASHDQPFFVGIAPIGPHAQTETINGVSTFTDPVPADRHRHLFADQVAPRKANFNPVNASGASYVKEIARLNDTVVDYLDEWYRNRLRALQAVDELVDAVMQKAEQLGILDNTYFIYTSDNGYTVGEHRRQPGKTTGYEEDIRVPLIVRGPGISANVRNDSVHSNIDLAATIVHHAGAEPSYDLDGRVIDWSGDRPTFRESGTATHHLSEFWVSQVGGAVEGKYSDLGGKILSKYRTLRIKEQGHDYAYTLWCTGERELYDMTIDSVQMNNLLSNSSFYGALNSTDGGSERLASRLDSLLLNLKACQGSLCRRLWYNLFPEGEVQSLEQALQSKWDDYFDRLPRVHFDNCRDGYFPTEELPAWRNELVYVNKSLIAAA